MQTISQEQPTLSVKLNEKVFSGLIDTGVDVTIIKGSDWPPTWPLRASITHFQCIRQSQNPLQRSEMLTWEDEERNKGQV